MAICRFCRQYGREDKHGLECISYGVRHNAHPDCLLKAKGPAAFNSLHDWQVLNFPAMAAHRAGLLEHLVVRCKLIKQKERAS